MRLAIRYKLVAKAEGKRRRAWAKKVISILRRSNRRLRETDLAAKKSNKGLILDKT